VVATSVNRLRGIEALRRVRDLVEEHGTDEQLDRLDRIMGGRVPAPNRAPVEYATYLTEAVAIAFEMIAEIKEAHKPRPRGRPRKDAARGEESSPLPQTR
jgi:hypothetical protein